MIWVAFAVGATILGLVAMLMPRDPPGIPPTMEEIEAAVKVDRALAIKLYRRRTQVSFEEAKEAVAEIARTVSARSSSTSDPRADDGG